MTGYLRLDGVSLVNGKSYVVLAQNIRIDISGTVAATDHYKFEIRADYTGAAAGTGSTEIGRSEISSAGTTLDDTAPPVFGWAKPSSDVTASFLLTATRVAGAATVSVQADTGGIWLTVIDMGWAVADTGVDV